MRLRTSLRGKQAACDMISSTLRTGRTGFKQSLHLQDFNTVLAAIRSHPGHVKVRMDFQRCNVA